MTSQTLLAVSQLYNRSPRIGWPATVVRPGTRILLPLLVVMTACFHASAAPGDPSPAGVGTTPAAGDTKPTPKRPDNSPTPAATAAPATIALPPAPAAASPGATAPDPVTPGAEPVAEIADDPVPDEPMAGGRVGPSTVGATGVDTVLSAQTGAVGTYRLRIAFGYFSTEDFLGQPDENRFSSSNLSAAFTPHRNVELFLAIRNTTNVNEASRPTLLQTQGDTVLGVKGGHVFGEQFSAGLAGSLHFASGLGSDSFAGDSTSAHLRALATLDLARAQEIPVRLHLDLGYYLENSEEVLVNQPDEVDMVQEFGLQTARYDRVTLGMALEATVSPYVTPFLEYRLDLPLEVEKSREIDSGQTYEFSTFPHWFTPGLRGYPAAGLAVDVAIRLGLGESQFPGVPATPPWRFIFGLSYTIDPRPVVVERIVEVVKQVAKPAPIPKEGTLDGRVVDAKTAKPIASAQISYPGRKLTAQMADATGRFTSYPLPSGPITIAVSAPRYLPSEVKTKTETGRATPVEVKLELDPAQQEGSLTVQTFSSKGKPIVARVSIGTPSNQSGMTGADGLFTFKLAPGKHLVTVSADSHEPQTREVTVEGGRESRSRFDLTRSAKTKKRRALVVVRKHSLEVRRKIHFVKGSSRVLPDSRAILNEVASVLKAHRELKKIRIDGHTDSRGSRKQNIRLSHRRAQSVMDYLVSRGVSASRLGVRGFGPDKPRSPNVTRRGRERNRRVEFKIVARSP